MAGNLNNDGFKRIPVHKITTEELKNTTFELPRDKEDKYSSQYFLSPTGTVAAKVMVIGTALEKEDVGTDAPFWKLRVADATGGIQVFAGQYQPEGAQIIANLELPCYVAVIGKISSYKPDSGTIISIRPDEIIVVDEQTRDDFVFESAEILMDKVRALKIDTVTLDKIKAAYPGMDPARYTNVALDALKTLLPKEKAQEKAADSVPPTPAAEPEKVPEAPNAPESTKEIADLTAKPEEAGAQKKAKAPAKAAVKAELKTKPSAKGGALPMDAKEAIHKIMIDNDAGTGIAIIEIGNKLRDAGVNPATLDVAGLIKKLMDEGRCYETKTGYKAIP